MRPAVLTFDPMVDVMTPGTPPATEERARAAAALRGAGIDIAVLSSVANVTYATGVETPVSFGAGAELTYAPWLAVFPTHGDGGALVAPRGSGKDAADNGFEPLAFATLDTWDAPDPEGTYLAQLHQALRLAGAKAGRGTLGVELRSLPVVAARAIERALPGWDIVDAEPALRAARRTKTPREVDLLRRAAHLADVSHTTLAELVRESGRNELAMFAEIGLAISQAAGRPVDLSGELVTGPRTTTVEYPNGPHDRVTRPGDAALMDLSGRLDGYWFDCTNTHAAEAAFTTFDLPMAHYAGHQVGVTVNELPRLVPYDHTPIEPGMVFCVEPGAYQGPGGTFGTRSEKMVLVTETGPEILSTFAWGI